MFIHIAKDFMKKLEDVDARLSVSLDKDEIQTLGLKLRFYNNELRHYKSLFNDVSSRIVEIQKKYGFAIEEADEPIAPIAAAPQTPAAEQLELPETPSKEPLIHGTQAREETLKVLSKWVSQLEQEGRDPAVILHGTEEYQKQTPAARQSLNISLPSEEPELLPEEEIPPLPQIGEQRAKHPAMAYAETMGGQASPATAGTITPATQPEPIAAPEPAPQPPRSVYTTLDDLFAIWAEDGLESEAAVAAVTERLRAILADRHAEAATGLDELLSGDKKIPQAEPGGTISFCWGWLAHRCGRDGQAVNLLVQAVSRGAGSAACYLALAKSCMARSLHEKALMNFKFASKIDPSLDEARLGAARCMIALGKPADSNDMLAAEAFAGEASRAEAALLRGEALEKLGRPGDAAALLSQAADAFSSPASSSRCLFAAGKIMEDTGDVLKAIDTYEAAIIEDPENLQARFHLGRLYINNQAFPLAKEQFNFLIKKFPGSEWTDRARELL